MRHTDIAIIGAGLAGLVSAISLKLNGFDVTILESSKIQKQNTTDSRTSHISVKHMAFFRELGLFDELVKISEPIKHIYIFEEGQKSIISFDPEESKSKESSPSEDSPNNNNHRNKANNAMGWVMPNSALKDILLQKVNSLNITILENTPLASIDHHQQFVYLNCNQGDIQQDRESSSSIPNTPNAFNDSNIEETDNKKVVKIRAKLTLVCTGRGSVDRMPILQSLGFSTKALSYHQSAIVFNINHTEHHKNIAIETFTPQGPLAMLPLPSAQEPTSTSGVSEPSSVFDSAEGQTNSPKNSKEILYQSSIIWTQTTQNASYISTLSDSELLDLFSQRATRFRHIGEIRGLASKAQVWPLSFCMANKAIENRVILLGDALNGVHPIIGQAFCSTMDDIKDITLHLLHLKSTGCDIGNPSLTASIKKKIFLNHSKLSFVTDCLVRTFSNNTPVVKSVRNLGLSIVEQLPFLKRKLIKLAGGK